MPTLTINKVFYAATNTNASEAQAGIDHEFSLCKLSPVFIIRR
jgi:hypothetical protein